PDGSAPHGFQRGLPDIASVDAAGAEACNRNADGPRQNDFVERFASRSRKPRGIVQPVREIVDIEHYGSGNRRPGKGAASGIVEADDRLHATRKRPVLGRAVRRDRDVEEARRIRGRAFRWAAMLAVLPILRKGPAPGRWRESRQPLRLKANR